MFISGNAFLTSLVYFYFTKLLLVAILLTGGRVLLCARSLSEFIDFKLCLEFCLTSACFWGLTEVKFLFDTYVF